MRQWSPRWHREVLRSPAPPALGRPAPARPSPEGLFPGEPFPWPPSPGPLSRELPSLWPLLPGFGQTGFPDRLSGQDRIRDGGSEQPHRSQRIVVSRNHEFDVVRIAVGVHHGDHWNPQLGSFLDGDDLPVRVHHEDDVGEPLHVLDAAQILVQLLAFPLQPGHFLLGQLVVKAVDPFFFQILVTPDAVPDSREIGQKATEPTVVDVVGLTSARFLLDRVLSLSLGADEQHRTTSDTPLDEEIDGPFEKPESGAEVDDVDAVSLSEDERFHFRIPAPCLMPEMNTGVQQLLDRNGLTDFPLATSWKTGTACAPRAVRISSVP